MRPHQGPHLVAQRPRQPYGLRQWARVVREGFGRGRRGQQVQAGALGGRLQHAAEQVALAQGPQQAADAVAQVFDAAVLGPERVVDARPCELAAGHPEVGVQHPGQAPLRSELLAQHAEGQGQDGFAQEGDDELPLGGPPQVRVEGRRIARELPDLCPQRFFGGRRPLGIRGQVAAGRAREGAQRHLGSRVRRLSRGRLHQDPGREGGHGLLEQVAQVEETALALRIAHELRKLCSGSSRSERCPQGVHRGGRLSQHLAEGLLYHNRGIGSVADVVTTDDVRQHVQKVFGGPQVLLQLLAQRAAGGLRAGCGLFEVVVEHGPVEPHRGLGERVVALGEVPLGGGTHDVGQRALAEHGRRAPPHVGRRGRVGARAQQLEHERRRSGGYGRRRTWRHVVPATAWGRAHGRLLGRSPERCRALP